MKRSGGLTFVAIVVILFSAIALLLSTLTAVFVIVGPTGGKEGGFPPELRYVMVVGTAFVAIIELFEVCCGIGLLKLWRWARYATIISGFIFGGVAALLGGAFAFMPLGSMNGVDESLIHVVRISMVLFYLGSAGCFLGMAGFLLRKGVAEQFQEGPLTESEPKPVAVWTVAGFMLIGLLSLPFSFFMNVPVLIFGAELSGWAGKLVTLGWALALGFTGISLFRRAQKAFRYAIGLHVLILINGLFNLRPGAFEQYLQHLPFAYSDSPNALSAATMARFGFVFAFLPLLLLTIGRKSYFAWCAKEAVRIAVSET